MRPQRMMRNGRADDPVFSTDEQLYMRIRHEWIDENYRIKPPFIRFPDQSVNREKYSEPYDVLLPNKDKTPPDQVFWGVASITVGNVPCAEKKQVENRDKKNQEAQLKFTVEHDPVEDNFGHSELRVYKNGTRETKGRVNDIAKKAYRTKLALKTRIVIDPVV